MNIYNITSKSIWLAQNKANLSFPLYPDALYFWDSSYEKFFIEHCLSRLPGINLRGYAELSNVLVQVAPWPKTSHQEDSENWSSTPLYISFCYPATQLGTLEVGANYLK